MALSDESGNMVMPVSPMYGNNGGFGGFGQDGWWILLLLLFAGGGWGFGGGFGNGFADGAMLYPWMNQSQQINDGFRDQMINGSISNIQNSITSGFGDVQNALCSGFATVNAGVANGFAQAEIADNARQMANMQTAFANHTAMNQGFNSIASQLASCCCENRLGLANLGADIAREACADRPAVSDGVRDIVSNQNVSVQRILDQMCNDKIDAKNEKIADLERQLTMANLSASQTAQTAQLLADNNRQTSALEQYLNPVPIPAYIVQNPNCCGQTPCGCAF